MSNNKYTAIAIDGPAGAGKSTIARTLAEKLGFIYVDTGALYRAVGLHGLRKGVDTTSAEAMLPLLDEIKLELTYIDGEQRVILCGEDVSEQIRVGEASMAASNVSAIQGVRDFLFDLQQNMAKTQNVVMDGRDIGTVVLPDAQVKIFLTADAQERARRRYEQLLQKGELVDYDAILQEVKQRDYNDSNRTAAPLRQAEDAILVDTTDHTLAQGIDRMEKIVREALEKRGQ